MKPKLVIFDVNETLLDLAPLREFIGGKLGGRSDLLSLWFSTTLHYSVVETVTGSYRSFGEVGSAALAMLAQREGLTLELDETTEGLARTLSNLPPHDDVRAGLEALQRQGYSMVSLSNSSQSGLEAQLANAGLDAYFAKCYSVEGVQKFKPHPDVYRYVLADWGMEASDAMMVAAHAWDLMGAREVGLKTAFIARPDCSLYPNAKRPEIVVRDLQALAVELEA